MRHGPWIVSETDRRSRTDGKCFYCPASLGEEHGPRCVIPKKTVVVKAHINVLISVPAYSTQDDVEFHLNESSWCRSNILSDIERAEPVIDEDGRTTGHCLCHNDAWEFVREATEEDERIYRYEPRDRHCRS